MLLDWLWGVRMDKTIIIAATMEERWLPSFLSFLKELEKNGERGHSEPVGFYSDGDGDFRPKFDFDIEYEEDRPRYISGRTIKVYDAG